MGLIYFIASVVAIKTIAIAIYLWKNGPPPAHPEDRNLSGWGTGPAEDD